MKMTPTKWRLIVAAHMNGDAATADIDSRRVKSRAIQDLVSDGLLFSRNADGLFELTAKGEEAYWTQSRAAA